MSTLFNGNYKKFKMACFAFIVGVAARFGLDLSVEEVGLLMSPFLVFIAAQGGADIGKEKALIENTERARVADKLFEVASEKEEATDA